MAQKAIQSAKYDFNVEAAPSYMQTPDGRFVKDGFTVNRRADTLAVLGKVTDRYGIVQNTDVISAAEDAFLSKGMTNYKRSIVVTGEGEKMYAVYDFKNHVKKLKKGDEIGLRLTVQNSFDGSLRASFALGMLRLICLNGMTALENEVSMTKKHSSGINLKFIIDALTRAITTWDNSSVVFERLADVNLTQEQGHTILENLKAQHVLSDKLREGIAGIWAVPTHTEDSERNLFNLYNAVTQYLTHEVSTERFELANRVSAGVLSVFERATRDTGRFQKLVTPIPVTIIVS
jgi:Domain of unknown function (DUF932)